MQKIWDMGDRRDDIFSSVLSEDAITQKLPSLFADSIILGLDYNITHISQRLLDVLGFQAQQLKGKSVNLLSHQKDLALRLKLLLSPGSFEFQVITLQNSMNEPVQIEIAGFYLGLISDINGFIILQVRNMDGAAALKQRQNADLDRFIYRTAHDLRGPLATIRGLTNLLKIKGGDEEFENLVRLLDANANGLDERLFRISYLARATAEHQSGRSVLNFAAVETQLRKVIEKNAFIDSLEFSYEAPSGLVHGVDEVSIEALLMNVLEYILSLPMTAVATQITFKLEADPQNIRVHIGISGFAIDALSRDGIQQHDFLYTDLIAYPQLISFYSARKIASGIGAEIDVEFVSDNSQKMTIVIPLGLSRPLTQ